MDSTDTSDVTRSSPRVQSDWPLHRKLDQWFEENKRREREGEEFGPKSKSDLARALGRPRSSVSNWYPPQVNVPGADVAAKLEELMSAPTSYLMNPALPWPPRALLKAELAIELCGWSEAEIDALAVISTDGNARKELMRVARKVERDRKELKHGR